MCEFCPYYNFVGLTVRIDEHGGYECLARSFIIKLYSRPLTNANWIQWALSWTGDDYHCWHFTSTELICPYAKHFTVEVSFLEEKKTFDHSFLKKFHFQGNFQYCWLPQGSIWKQRSMIIHSRRFERCHLC